jgi:hypothetical protein
MSGGQQTQRGCETRIRSIKRAPVRDPSIVTRTCSNVAWPRAWISRTSSATRTTRQIDCDACSLWSAAYATVMGGSPAPDMSLALTRAPDQTARSAAPSSRLRVEAKGAAPPLLSSSMPGSGRAAGVVNPEPLPLSCRKRSLATRMRASAPYAARARWGRATSVSADEPLAIASAAQRPVLRFARAPSVVVIRRAAVFSRNANASGKRG